MIVKITEYNGLTIQINSVESETDGKFPPFCWSVSRKDNVELGHKTCAAWDAEEAERQAKEFIAGRITTKISRS